MTLLMIVMKIMMMIMFVVLTMDVMVVLLFMVVMVVIPYSYDFLLEHNNACRLWYSYCGCWTKIEFM
jgi:hypothetical protein